MARSLTICSVHKFVTWLLECIISGYLESASTGLDCICMQNFLDFETSNSHSPFLARSAKDSGSRSGSRHTTCSKVINFNHFPVSFFLPAFIL